MDRQIVQSFVQTISRPLSYLEVFSYFSYLFRIFSGLKYLPENI